MQTITEPDKAMNALSSPGKHCKTTQLRREVEIYQIMSEAGIAPNVEVVRVECGHDCDDKFWILQSDLWTQTLYDALAKDHSRVDEFAKQGHALLSAMHNLGYAHGDVHLRNMVVKDGRMALIDFEDSLQSLTCSDFDSLTANEHGKFDNQCAGYRSSST